jgi:hypothetical protein
MSGSSSSGEGGNSPPPVDGPQRITPETADAVRRELELLDRSWEPDGPNPIIARLKITRLLGDVAAKLVLGRNKRLREAGQGPVSNADMQILVDATADLEAMTPKRSAGDE